MEPLTIVLIVLGIAAIWAIAELAMTLRKAQIFLVSDLEDDFVRSIFLTPQSSAQAALDEAFRQLGPEAKVLAMPFGGSTLPRITGGSLHK